MAHRMLVIANRTCPCPAVHDRIVERAAERAGTEVFIVAPALNRRLAHWVSDTDGAVLAARERLDFALARLRERGVQAEGDVGDGDPFIALQDVLARSGADEVLVATHPPGDSHWLAKDLVQRARDETGLPVEHLVTPYGLERDVAAG